MPEQSEQNQAEALAGALAAESRAAARGQAFAQKAEQEGLAGWARLLRAQAEEGATADNLRQAFVEEAQARAGEYERLAEAARQAGEKTLAMALTQAVRAEERYAELYAQAGDDPAGPGAQAYAVCQVCGSISPPTSRRRAARSARPCRRNSSVWSRPPRAPGPVAACRGLW